MKVLQWLKTRGDISTVDNLGGTPLHDAAEQGEFEVRSVDATFFQSDPDRMPPTIRNFRIINREMTSSL